MPQYYILAQLLSNNARWADEVKKRDPNFFVQSAAEDQTPKILWFGCSDSRVPESVVTASMPGDIFVHRNIANQFHPDDDSALAVLYYAVAHVRVQHVILVGHTNCGGAKACLANAHAPTPTPPPVPNSALGRWLARLTKLARDYDDLTALIEANVREQVRNTAATDVVRSAWAQGRDVQVHGWVYELETGRLRDLGISVGKTGAV
ncbi:carbonic anhydrase 1 [Trametes punicea]|nr:carbonic anhydrase 1 [Trametes punicea]